MIGDTGGDTSLIKDLSEMVEYGDFLLDSGKRTKYYIDIKNAVVNPEILKKIAKEIKELITIHDIAVDAIACIEVGSIPIGTAISLDMNKPMIIIREERKIHGITGDIIGNVKKGSVVLLIDDVTTTGGTVIRAIKVLKDAGSTVFYVISVVDREEGALEILDKMGVCLISIFSKRDLNIN